MTIPGWVDATSVEEVSAVLAAVGAADGPGGVVDLLGRLPGVTRTPGTSRGLFRAAVPGRLWLGPEDAVSAEPQPVLEQVVGGVVLHRTMLTPSTTPGLLAALVVRLAASTAAAYDDVSAVLTAARETTR